MEAKKEDQTCSLKLKFIKGQTAAGKDVYAVVTYGRRSSSLSAVRS